MPAYTNPTNNTVIFIPASGSSYSVGPNETIAYEVQNDPGQVAITGGTIGGIPLEIFLLKQGQDLSYIHYQLYASSTWVVVHNLGKFPSVSVVDSAGTLVVGNVTYLSANQLIITFHSPFGGTAYLN